MLKQFLNKVVAGASRTEQSKTVQRPKTLLRVEGLESRVMPTVE